MDEKAVPPKVRDALSELREYLSDTIAPLVAADSISLLSQHSPNLIVSEIQAWMTRQYRSMGTDVPISDYLFHALKKIHLIGEFELVPREQMERLLAHLKKTLIEICPEEDRTLLQVHFEHLGQSETEGAAAVSVLHRPPASTQRMRVDAVSSVGADDVARLDRRLSLLLERLEGATASAGGSHTERQKEHNDLVAEALTVAAQSARTGAEFRQYSEGLRKFGADTSMQEIFRSLGRSLPDWAAPQAKAGATGVAAAHQDAPAEAMHRIVSIEEDPAESTNRLYEMIQAAVEQFNGGSLARAATIFSLASIVMHEKKINPAVLGGLQARARGSLDSALVRKWAEDRSQHVLLRKIFDFFPSFSPEVLLDELQGEQIRDRRRAVLALLTAHGEGVRQKVLERLERSATQFGDSDWQYQRNLLFLLRGISSGEAPAEGELDLVIGLSEMGRPSGLLKEALLNLGQSRHERSEQAVIQRLGQIEIALRKPEASAYERSELFALLDRVIAALARIGTPRAARAVIAHALQRKPYLGNTVGRLTELAGQDLSSHGELVEQLVEAMMAELPKKVLGLRVQGDKQKLSSYVTALAATPSDRVRQALAEIAERYPDEDFGKAATHALTTGGKAPDMLAAAQGASLSGDLLVFGLPTVLQNLADSRATGVLMLSSSSGASIGALALRAGRIVGCQSGHLRGMDAVFQLFERPEPGTFALVSDPASAAAIDEHAAVPESDTLPLIMEGMRRYDDLRRAAAVVPDATSLKPTGTKPRPLLGETDRSLQRAVWRRAASGATALSCETDMPADSYRIRRLLFHWVEQGALAESAVPSP